MVGRAAFRAKDKFEFLKSKLKQWNKDVFGVVDKKIKELEQEVNELDLKGENAFLSESKIIQRKKLDW